MAESRQRSDPVNHENVNEPARNLQQQQAATFDQNVKTTKEIKIVFVGRSGAGKSTLLRSMFNIEVEEDPEKPLLSPGRDTMDTKTWHTNHKNGVSVSVTDTVGLEENKEAEILKKLSKDLKGQEIDLVVYCLPVAPGSRFGIQNSKMVKELCKAFGKEMWKHCFVAFTFSNQALDRLKRGKKPKEKIETEYKEYVKGYSKLLEDEIKKIVGKDFRVKVVFKLQSEAPMENMIVAIPVGDESTDEVLPDFRKESVTFTVGEEQVKIEHKDWKDVVFTEMVKKCHRGKDLLKYRYGPAIFIGGVIGAVVGGAAGVAGGPPGVVAGVGVGAAMGAGAGSYVQ